MKSKKKNQDFHYVSNYSRHGDINDYLGEIIGPEFDEYREIWNKAHNLEIETNFPTYLSLETLMKCNYRCTMCTYSDPKEVKKIRYKEQLSDELYDKIIYEVNKHNCPSMGFNMLNEPLLDKKIIKRIKLASDAGIIDSRMNTNASLLTEEKAEEIVDSGLTRLLVGLDAFTPDTYKKVRIGGDFDLVMRNVDNFLKIREKKGKKLPILRVSFVRLSINEMEIADFIDHWKNRADLVAIQEYQPPFDNDEYVGKHAVSKLMPKDYTCPQPHERMVIKGNGNLYPCCAQYNHTLVMGNLQENSIQEIWTSEHWKKMRRHMKERTWEQLETCKKCLQSSYLHKN